MCKYIYIYIYICSRNPPGDRWNSIYIHGCLTHLWLIAPTIRDDANCSGNAATDVLRVAHSPYNPP